VAATRIEPGFSAVTPELWKQVQAQLDLVLALAPAERKSFLHELGTRDFELRQEVESLLAGETDNPDFLQAQQLVGLLRTAVAAESKREPLIGYVLGSYRIIALLGTGGNGGRLSRRPG